jgi:hypothetical protein
MHAPQSARETLAAAATIHDEARFKILRWHASIGMSDEIRRVDVAYGLFFQAATIHNV